MPGYIGGSWWVAKKAGDAVVAGKNKAEDVKDKTLGAVEDLNNFFKNIGDFFKSVFGGIADFFKELTSYRYFVLIIVIFVAVTLLKKR